MAAGSRLKELGLVVTEGGCMHGMCIPQNQQSFHEAALFGVDQFITFRLVHSTHVVNMWLKK